MATVGSIFSEELDAASPTRLRCRRALPVKPHTPLSPDRRGKPLTDQLLTLVVLASCLLLSSLAPRTSAVGYAVLGATSAASGLTVQRTEPSSDSGNDDDSFRAAPMHVFRDPATGNLVEEAEPERREDEQQVDSAAALAAELDALYMEDSAPVRGRGNLATKLGRKSGVGGFSGSGSSSSKGGAGSIVKDRGTALSSTDPTAAAVSASSLGSSWATRSARRGSRRLSFNH